MVSALHHECLKYVGYTAVTIPEVKINSIGPFYSRDVSPVELSL